jgi:hypothetical protein
MLLNSSIARPGVQAGIFNPGARSSTQSNRPYIHASPVLSSCRGPRTDVFRHDVRVAAAQADDFLFESEAPAPSARDSTDPASHRGARACPVRDHWSPRWCGRPSPGRPRAAGPDASRQLVPSPAASVPSPTLSPSDERIIGGSVLNHPARETHWAVTVNGRIMSLSSCSTMWQ